MFILSNNSVNLEDFLEDKMLVKLVVSDGAVQVPISVKDIIVTT